MGRRISAGPPAGHGRIRESRQSPMASRRALLPILWRKDGPRMAAARTFAREPSSGAVSACSLRHAIALMADNICESESITACVDRQHGRCSDWRSPWPRRDSHGDSMLRSPNRAESCGDLPARPRSRHGRCSATAMRHRRRPCSASAPHWRSRSSLARAWSRGGLLVRERARRKPTPT